jgi:DNA polymerase (family X)
VDSRSAAHVLSQIASLLELRGENTFKVRAYSQAARSLLTLAADDLGPLYRSGELGRLRGIGPATLSVLRDLVETGESRYYAELTESTPEGLIEMLRIPGLGTSKIHKIYEALGIQTVEQLEEAARDGRLAKLPRFGAKTAEKILKGIGLMRETGTASLLSYALGDARVLEASVASHPDVVRAETAGSVRRRLEIIRDVDVVAGCRASPAVVAASFARAPSVREVIGGGGSSITIRYVDGTLLDLYCVSDADYPVALWRATGSAEHLEELRAHASTLGFTVDEESLRDRDGNVVALPDERALFTTLGLAYIPAELREGRGEVSAAAAKQIPTLIEPTDIRGALHCHSQYSDGKATIAQMAAGAQARGWSYLGITDHSQSAFYAGGLSRDAVLQQHDEIDALNETLLPQGFRVLKGIEADILVEGQVDYDAELLARFDYVIGSVHSRFGLGEVAMTERVLRALDDPNLTILGHPTGRLLLTREPYEIDLDAVLEKAAEKGVAVELNADPHRLDIDWRFCRQAKELGVTIEIGPDAHSVSSLDYINVGVMMARKGWLEANDVLNARGVDSVLEFAARRRNR